MSLEWLALPPLPEELLEILGREWVCEQHPDKPWPHDDCAGPGMLKGDDALLDR